nr:hypothetical protein [uncultured Albidiferax sp.]
MKHLVILLGLLVLVYSVWHFSQPLTRRNGVRFMARHGLRLGACALVLLALLVLAYFIPSIHLI